MADARKVALGVTLATLAAASWWITHRTAEPTATPSVKTRHVPDYTLEDFIGNAMNPQGARKYVLTAQIAVHYPDDDTTHFTHPILVQYLPGGVIATARGDTGVMPGDASEILMTGDVHVVRTAGKDSNAGEINADRMRIELDR